MSKAAEIRYDGPKRNEVTLHVNIRMTRRYQVRLWIACRLIALAGWVARCRVQFDEGENDASA